jgi:hypothetical protein
MRVLDLFSGLGGASEAFLRAGDEVIRIENNPALFHIPETILFDINSKEFDNFVMTESLMNEPFDLIWASPPCLEFSMAYNAPKSVARREGKNFKPNMELLLHAKEIIDYLQPKYWVIENVMGAQEFFNPILGKPTQIINSFCLWGNFPGIVMPPNYHHLKHDVGSKNPLRSNYRAIIPFEVSEQLRRSIIEQKTLGDWV